MAPRTPRKHCLCSDSKRPLQSSPTRTPCAGRPSLDCWRSAFSPCKTGWTTLTSRLQHRSRALTIRSSRTCFVTPKLRSEEHTSELQSLMRISYAVFCLKKKHTTQDQITTQQKQMQRL